MNWKHKLLLPLTKAKAVAQRTYKRLWQYKGRQLRPPLTVMLIFAEILITITRRLCADVIILIARCIIFVANWIGYGLDIAKNKWYYSEHL